MLRTSSEVVLPDELPPAVRQTWTTDADGIPLVNFYSENQPVVTVCTGTRAKCLSVNKGAETFWEGDVDGRPAMILIGRHEGDDSTGSTLSAAMANFWKSVELTVNVPSWLNAS